MITVCIRTLFIAAFVLVALLPQLPTVHTLLVAAAGLALATIVAWFALRSARRRAGLLVTAALLSVLLWAMGWGSWQLQNRLDSRVEGVDLWVEGRIDGLVSLRQAGGSDECVIQRFNLTVLSGADDAGGVAEQLPKRLRLTMYDGPQVLGGEGWRLRVRLKRPHGFANPGGFDYERWLLSRSVGGTGYVRLQAGAAADAYGAERRPALDNGFQRWRETLRQELIAHYGDGRSTAVLLALSIGDLSLLGQEDSRTAQQLGLIHLLTISGLHIGLAATVGFWLGRLLGGLLSLAWPMRIYGPHCAWLGAVMVAVGYGAVAGYSLATQRSVIVLVVGALWFCCYRRYSVWLGWWLSMLAVLLWHPLAVLEPGFWFSFVAVAILLVLLARPVCGWHGKLWLLVKLQCVLFLFMGALQVFWGMGVSGVSPLVNLIAVPYVSLLIVPPILLALLLNVAFGSGAQVLWQLLIWLIDGFWWGLDTLQPLAEGLLFSPVAQASLVIVLLGCAGLCLTMLPLSLFTRVLGALALMAVVLPAPRDHPPLTLTVLDVGQGLAVLAGSGDQWLLYDTGPGLSPEFDAGAAVVVPYLFAQGIRRLDTGVISHWDVDHSGGLKSVLEGVQVERWLSGGVVPAWVQRSKASFGDCNRDFSRRLGQWTLRVLANPLPHLPGDRRYRNNSSCVVLLEAPGVRVLLPGDIEQDRERSLLNHPWLAAPVDILVAPHHGSGTSSSPAFVQQLAPRYVVFSAGYRNRYRHPQSRVVERYRQAGARLLLTSQTGAVTFTWLPAPGGGAPLLQVNSYRDQQRRYWRQAAGEES